jgi:hypothetical protein
LNHLNGIAEIERWQDAFLRSFDLNIVVFSNATFLAVNFIRNVDAGNIVADLEVSSGLLNLRGSTQSSQIMSVSTQEKNFDVSNSPFYVKTQQECIVFESRADRLFEIN